MFMFADLSSVNVLEYLYKSNDVWKKQSSHKQRSEEIQRNTTPKGDAQFFDKNINIIQIKFQAHVSLCLHSRLVYMEGFCTEWRRIH